MQQKKAQPKTQTLLELNQQKRIAILEAQLALNSSASPTRASSSISRASKSSRSRTSQSKLSRASSRSTDHSPITAASVHSRLDGFEVALQNIQQLLVKLTTPASNTESYAHRTSSPTTHRTDPVWPTLTEARSPGKEMAGIQLIPQETRLTILESPIKPPKSKRKKTAVSPQQSNLRLQYKDPTGVDGGDSC